MRTARVTGRHLVSLLKVDIIISVFRMDDATLTDEDRHNLREYNRLMGKYKTSLCIQFKVTGSCTYGDECRYAHGQEELRPKTVCLVCVC